jgi:type I restriction enzyme R subunit
MHETTKFTEKTTVQDYVVDLLQHAGWQYMPPDELRRKTTDILVNNDLTEALVKLNPCIAEKPERADEVIFKLKAIILAAGDEGVVRANERFAAWVKGEMSMPFGKNNQHLPIKLIDFENFRNNKFVVTDEYSVQQKVTKRPDIVCLINGIPVVVGECKTPVRPSVTWLDGAIQISNDYEVNIPGLFVTNLFSFATEGKEYRYNSIRAPLEQWAPWRTTDDNKISLKSLEIQILDMFRLKVVLDILNNFTVFATDKKNRKIKIICRHQQFEATNKIVERVIEGQPKKGLIWHFQGSGKSLLMVFAAQKLRLHPDLKSPTVLIVVDRIDLDTQITATFNAADVPNTVTADTRAKLHQMLDRGMRKIIITTIHKFAEAGGMLNDRGNIIVMVDEAHRTQEGDLGLQMRTALPNAFFFGLTGTPIAKRDRNTFATFGHEDDEGGYLSKYSFVESMRDKATLELHFEPRLIEMHVDSETIDREVATISNGLTDEEKYELTKRAAKMPHLIRTKKKIQEIAEDIITHYKSNVEPNGFKAMVVAYDRAGCVEYKKAFDELIPEEYTDIVMTVAQSDPEEVKRRWKRSKEDEEKLLDRFRDPRDPLKILIVTMKLLTGFDAPILQTMYLDKILRDHTLLQAVCRTNRPYPHKAYGLIVDYIGVFDEIAKTLTYNDEGIRDSIRNINAIKGRIHGAMKKCLDYFPGIDRTRIGYEGLIEAQECLPDNEVRDAFGTDYSILNQLWEAISPDPVLSQYKDDYRWLSQIYESVQPPSGIVGRLVWHRLGPKTLDIINENIHVDAIRDDLETIALDEEMVEELMKTHAKPHKVIEIKISRRLKKHESNPKFKSIGQKLEELKERYEKGFLDSLAYLKALLALAKELLEVEREVEPEDERKKARAALTELFYETKTEQTPKMIERIVTDIDSVVAQVRFDGWKWSKAGVREVKKALRRTLMKYKLHKESELFDRAFAYIRQYY